MQDLLEPVSYPHISMPEYATGMADYFQPTQQIEVSRGGAISLYEAQGAPERRLSEVPSDTFYGRLDDIANAVREAQANNGVPKDDASRIYTDRDGGIRLGTDVHPGERVSEVTPDTFFGRLSLVEEARFARDFMPSNTLHVAAPVEGWSFTITNELGDSYSLFMLWNDGFGCYQVLLISPRMDGGIVDSHGTHLWSDGTLCLTHRLGSGYPTMRATYAKAALWTRGASFFRRGHGFQFNIGQSA